MILEKIITIVVIIIVLILMVVFIIKNKSIKEKLKLIRLKILFTHSSPDRAKKYALKMVDLYPQSYMAHKLLGQLYEKEGKINVALDEYIRAVELKHDDYEMHYKVALLLRETEKNEESVIMLQDLLKMKPDYLEATLLLGDILYEEERFKEAVSVYMMSLRYHPTEYEIYYNLGMVFTRLNDFQKAKEEFNTGKYTLVILSKSSYTKYISI